MATPAENDFETSPAAPGAAAGAGAVTPPAPVAPDANGLTLPQPSIANVSKAADGEDEEEETPEQVALKRKEWLEKTGNIEVPVITADDLKHTFALHEKAHAEQKLLALSRIHPEVAALIAERDALLKKTKK